MEIRRGSYRYWTVRFDDSQAGCSGFKLYQETFGETTEVAVVIYWDAAPGFFIKTLGDEIPVEIAEAVIAEAREQIKYK